MKKHQLINAKTFKKGNRRYICEVHRELFELLKKDDFNRRDKKQAIYLVKEAYEYGVKMSQKLHEYAGKDWVPEVFLKLNQKDPE